MCEHKKFDAKVNTIRSDTKPPKFYIEVALNCSQCGVPFRFGHSFVSSTDGLQLTANIEPGPHEPNRALAEMHSDYDYLRGGRVS